MMVSDMVCEGEVWFECVGYMVMVSVEQDVQGVWVLCIVVVNGEW